MEKIRQNGFVLVLVIAVIGLIAAEMFILTDISNSILFQADTAYLEACEQNLASSGLAWVRKNSGKENIGKTIKLDVSDMDISRSALSVTIEEPKSKEAKVRISTSCTRGRQTFTHSDKYRIMF
jgi:hypothetical protein